MGAAESVHRGYMRKENEIGPLAAHGGKRHQYILVWVLDALTAALPHVGQPE